MGNIKSTQSDKFIDCKKKIYIVMDLYLKSKFNYEKNFDIDKLKTNSSLKNKIIDILVNSLIKNLSYKISIVDNNLIFITKIDENNIKYLEINTVLEFTKNNEKETDTITNNIPTSIYKNGNKEFISKEYIKLNIISEFFNYVNYKYEINIQYDNLIILYNTLYNIEIYQK